MTLLAIGFDECIDCAVDVSEFEVAAVLKGENVPGDRQDFTPLFAGLACVRKPTTKTQPVRLDAGAWTPLVDKRARLERRAHALEPGRRRMMQLDSRAR
mgnify:FL=1